MLRRRDVLGEIEIMEPERMRRRRDILVEGIRKARENGFASGERRAHRVSVAEVDGMDGEGRAGERMRVEASDVES